MGWSVYLWFIGYHIKLSILRISPAKNFSFFYNSNILGTNFDVDLLKYLHYHKMLEMRQRPFVKFKGLPATDEI